MGLWRRGCGFGQDHPNDVRMRGCGFGQDHPMGVWIARNACGSLETRADAFAVNSCAQFIIDGLRVTAS